MELCFSNGFEHNKLSAWLAHTASIVPRFQASFLAHSFQAGDITNECHTPCSLIMQSTSAFPLLKCNVSLIHACCRKDEAAADARPCSMELQPSALMHPVTGRGLRRT